jgi:Holliday junction resolvasome RuvABC endonuclease subunit
VRLAIGIDPGFAQLGVAVLAFDERRVEVLEVGVWLTEKSDKKRSVKSVDDDFRRTREIAAKMISLFDFHRPSIVTMESKSAVRNASAAAKVSAMIGVLACEAERWGIPAVQASPAEVRTALELGKKASKEEIEARVRSRLNSQADLDYKFKDIPEAKRVHAWDAIAAWYACEKTDVVRAARMGA